MRGPRRRLGPRPLDSVRPDARATAPAAPTGECMTSVVRLCCRRCKEARLCFVDSTGTGGAADMRARQPSAAAHPTPCTDGTPTGSSASSPWKSRTDPVSNTIHPPPLPFPMSLLCNDLAEHPHPAQHDHGVQLVWRFFVTRSDPELHSGMVMAEEPHGGNTGKSFLYITKLPKVILLRSEPPQVLIVSFLLISYACCQP